MVRPRGARRGCLVAATVPALLLMVASPVSTTASRDAKASPASRVTSNTSPPSLHMSGGGGTRLPAPAPPAGWLAGGQQGLAFTAGGLGFLASGPPGYTGKPPFAAEIQRTRDRGRSWATVWRRTGYRLTWIGTAGGSVVAAGLSANGLQPLLLQGDPTGTSWHLVDVSISPAAVPSGVQAGTAASALAEMWGSYQLHFVDQSLGFAAPDPMVGMGAVSQASC